MSGDAEPALVAALHDAQRLGFLGPRPIPEVIRHARGFVRALAAWESIDTIVDLGSGAGVPGLIIAHDLPHARVTLLDRRAKRTDALERVVRRLGWQDRVSVVCDDVDRFGPPASFDAVVARGFGPPEFTLSSATRLVRAHHPIVISEPPDHDRWDDGLLERLQLRRVESAPVLSEVTDPGREPGTHAGNDHLDGLVAVFTTR